MTRNANKEQLLDGYVQKKLRQDECQRLLNRLAESSIDIKITDKSVILEPRYVKITPMDQDVSEDQRTENSSDDYNIEDESSEEELEVTIQENTKNMYETVSESTNEKFTLDRIKRIMDKEQFVATITRNDDVQVMRMKLPILEEEDKIMDAIHNNLIVIVCGETGSGKTTQLPQFLYEAGYGNRQCSFRGGRIGITQPRRLATVTTCSRVSEELGINDSRVAYRIRYESTADENTDILFMTDGVLLRELENDLLLSNYSVIIIDEAHERSLNTDILIGILGRVVIYREKQFLEYFRGVGIDSMSRTAPKLLRLVIMSATLNIQEFVNNRKLFPLSELSSESEEYPPVVRIATRQYPVSIHFNRKTPVDYIEDAFHKVIQIHKEQASGNILVFVTGEDEVWTLVKRLEDWSREDTGMPLFALPLFSLLPIEDQLRVFKDSRTTTGRICVISTNVAETSLTIPNIVYVVDTGKVKERVFNDSESMEAFVIKWISKSSANQRSGRAGRTEPGHCYRLYSSSVYHDLFDEFSLPEILRTPCHLTILQMKSMNIENVQNFPFPTPINPESLKMSEAILIVIGALRYQKVLSHGAIEYVSVITGMGRKMSLFPLNPRLSKMIVSMASQKNILRYVIILVSILSVGNPFSKAGMVKDTPLEFADSKTSSDLVILVTTMIEYINNSPQERKAFGIANHLRLKLMEEALRIREKILSIIRHHFNSGSDIASSLSKVSGYPTNQQWEDIVQCFLNAYCDHIARIDPHHKSCYQILELAKELIDHTPVYSWYNVIDSERVRVKVSSNSIIHRTEPRVLKWIVYEKISVQKDKNNRTQLILKNCSLVEEQWISIYCRVLCKPTEIIDSPSPFYDNQYDKIKCLALPRIAGTWKLSPMDIEMTEMNTSDPFKWFSKFILDGVVFPELSAVSHRLNCKTDILIRRYTINRTAGLWGTLAKCNICSKSDLLKRLLTDPKYLLASILSWYYPDIHDHVRSIWLSLPLTNHG